jgi:hypothetical protein
VSRIYWRITESLWSLSDKFLYVFKTGPSGARMRAAATGRAACPALRFAALQVRPLAWRARAAGCRVEDSRTRHQ